HVEALAHDQTAAPHLHGGTRAGRVDQHGTVGTGVDDTVGGVRQVRQAPVEGAAVQQPLDLVQGRDHDDRRAAQVDARFEGVEAVDLGESHRGDTRVRDEPGHPLVVRTGQQDQIAVAGLAEQVVRSYCTH